MKTPILTKLLGAMLLALCLVPRAVLACATCSGKTDSKLAEGMNVGILVLLGFIGFVLIWFVGFFVYLARRASRTAVEALPEGINT